MPLVIISSNLSLIVFVKLLNVASLLSSFVSQASFSNIATRSRELFIWKVLSPSKEAVYLDSVPPKSFLSEFGIFDLPSLLASSFTLNSSIALLISISGKSKEVPWNTFDVLFCFL